MLRRMCLFLLLCAGCAQQSAPPSSAEGAEKIEHLIIIFQENWSFDSFFGKFPGANGIAEAKPENLLQEDKQGKPFATLPACIDTRTHTPYPQIPQNLPNAPFDLAPYISMREVTGDVMHRFYQEQYQINGGKMNRFAAWGDSGGFAMSYYDITETALGRLAKQYVLCDNWFHSCFGGSMCGALWLFSAQMPLWPHAPEEFIAQLSPAGELIRDGRVSPDGYAINDAEPFFRPTARTLPMKSACLRKTI